MQVKFVNKLKELFDHLLPICIQWLANSEINNLYVLPVIKSNTYSFPILHELFNKKIDIIKKIYTPYIEVLGD